MNIHETHLLRLVKYQVIVGLVMLFGFFGITAVFGQTNTPAPTSGSTMIATPTVVIPNQAPSTGRAAE